MANNGNITIHNYLPDTILDDLGMLQCVNPSGADETAEEFFQRVNDNGWVLIATHSNVRAGTTSIGSGVLTLGSCTAEQSPSYEEAYNSFISTYPDSLEPKYYTDGNIIQSPIKMGDAVLARLNDYTGAACGDIDEPFSYSCIRHDVNTSYYFWRINAAFVADYDVYGSVPGFSCPINSTLTDGSCLPDEGWQWNPDGSGTLIPTNPGIPSGPTPKPPTVLDPDRTDPENHTCPDCYEYDAIQDVCIYVGGEGCEEEVPCVKTASCDDELLITGNCIDRNEC